MWPRMGDRMGTGLHKVDLLDAVCMGGTELVPACLSGHLSLILSSEEFSI